METSGALGLCSSAWSGFGKIGGGATQPTRFPGLRRRENDVSFRRNLRSIDVVQSWRVKLRTEVCCSYKNSGASTLKPESLHAITDEALILKRAAEDVAPSLSGRCVYLVGMMGSGKTTIGKVLAEALGYSFVDSDRVVELAFGGTSVAQIFTEHSENFFRENESKALKELSAKRRFVIATGGGAVIRPVNWRYMKQGITIWLDVPLEALAKRIAAVGTSSRPLLHQESGDAYSEALERLRTLFEERGESYGNADITVSLQCIAGKQDVNSLTPTKIAIEALAMMKDFLTKSCFEEVTISRDEP